jgi:hypothetical protein
LRVWVEGQCRALPAAAGHLFRPERHRALRVWVAGLCRALGVGHLCLERHPGMWVLVERVFRVPGRAWQKSMVGSFEGRLEGVEA